MKTNKLLRFASDGSRCRLEFLKTGSGEDFLDFPSDQLSALIGLALQVERKALAEAENNPKIKNALKADGVEVAKTFGNVIFDFHVGEMKFAFQIANEQIPVLKKIMQNL